MLIAELDVNAAMNAPVSQEDAAVALIKRMKHAFEVPELLHDPGLVSVMRTLNKYTTGNTTCYTSKLCNTTHCCVQRSIYTHVPFIPVVYTCPRRVQSYTIRRFYLSARLCTKTDFFNPVITSQNTLL
eukprot:4822860-Pleurochrysis_carterae.AAC.1